MSEIDDIQNELKGNSLALGAVAEVLQKMDARLSKQEEDEEEKEEKEMEKAAHEELAKSITSMVLSNLKKEDPDNKLGLDTDGKERSAKATGSPAADTEKPISPTTKIEDQQNAIQASTEASLSKEGDKEDEDEKIEEMKDEATEDDADEDVDKGDDDAKEEPEDADEIEAMKKTIAALEKQVASFDLEKAIATETEARLRKMGFREENGLQRPQVFTPDNPNVNPLGTDGTTPIVKGNNAGDTAEQLTSLSYRQLRELQQKVDSGDTSGVPRELLG